MSHGTYEWCKIRRKTDLLFQKFWPEGSKFSKFPLWLVPLCKVNNVSHQNSTDELCAMTMKNDPTFEEESLQNWHEKFDKFLPEHLKVSKICALMGSFWTKYIMFELKKYRGVMFHDNEKWSKIWRKADFWFGKWRKEFGKVLPEHSEVSKLRLLWDSFIQSRKCISLKFTGELCIMTMKNDSKFEEELTCRFKIDTTIWRILTRALEYL